MTYPLRYFARFVVEAASALTIGTGETGLSTDELVATDVNGLPMIPGTALCGVLRHMVVADLGEEKTGDLFGFQNGADGRGARLMITSAHMIGQDGQVIDGLAEINWSDSFYTRFQELPMRDHCRINEKGAADVEGHGKFDEQVVYKGTRFCFEMELQGNEKDEEQWTNLVDLISSPMFRVGGGTRKGFGALEVKAREVGRFDLQAPSELNAYLAKSSKLQAPEKVIIKEKDVSTIPGWHNYVLELTPDDFFFFGSGYGDDEVDDAPKTEPEIGWSNQTPIFRDCQMLIPASSVKGAISHRLAYHYNRLAGVTVEGLSASGESLKSVVGENNTAVKALFGFAKDSKADKRQSENDPRGQRGRVVFSDVLLPPADTKILNHVAIDRFTGGALDGALFSEKVCTKNIGPVALNIWVHDKAFEEENVKQALEATLGDICTGILPLGGNVMKGHGCFNGSVKLDGEELS